MQQIQNGPTIQLQSKIVPMNIVIDKLHYMGHTDASCKKHCDPYKFVDLNKVCVSIPSQKRVC